MRHSSNFVCFVIALASCDSTSNTPLDAGQDTTPATDVTPTPDSGRPDVMTADVTPDVPVMPAGSANVLSYYGDAQRTGAYRSETRITPEALRAGRLRRDAAFAPTLSGALYSQPLYMAGLMVGGARRDVLFVATANNDTYALDADTGAELWRTSLGPGVVQTPARMVQQCGNMNNIGVTSTPVIDAASNTMYLVSLNNMGGLQFRIHALDITTGMERAGYPTRISPPASNGGTFTETTTGQRGALGYRNGMVFIPFGGLYGDCGTYHGWVVGVNAMTPTEQSSWATPARGSGIWSPAGITMDDSGNVYVATGNGTLNSRAFVRAALGESVLRIATDASGPRFDMADTTSIFTASNASNLDMSDTDIGSVSPVLVPGFANPPVVVQGGKEGVLYVLDGSNLGAPSMAPRRVGGGIYGAVSAWSNGETSYVFAPTRGSNLCGRPNGVVALRVTRTSSEMAWCTTSSGNSNPPVVSSNGNNDAVLWVTTSGPSVLRAYEVSSGEEIYANTEPPPSLRQWVPPVVANGKVYLTGATSVVMYRLM
jgi:outer membrane protein assembly factor BamB